MNPASLRPFLPALLIFIILNGSFLVFGTRFRSWGFDPDVLIIGNLLIFAISVLSFFMSRKGLQAKSNHVFFRMVYGGFILKLFILATAALIYIMLLKKDVNKPALFFCMGLYLLYTFIEVSALMKLSRKKENA